MVPKVIVMLIIYTVLHPEMERIYKMKKYSAY